MPGTPRSAAFAPMVTIFPPPLAIIPGITAEAEFNNVFTFTDQYFLSDVTLLHSKHIYNYTLPIFKAKLFTSSRLNKINRFDYESNQVIDNFWFQLIKQNKKKQHAINYI